MRVSPRPNIATAVDRHVIPQGLASRNSPGVGLGVGLTGPRWWCLVGGAAGSFPGPVAGSVHEDLVAGVDQSVQQRFGHDGVGEQRIPVLGSAVAGQDEGFASDGPIGDQIVEIVGLGGGVLTHREVIDDQYQRAGVFAHALTDGAIGVTTGQIGEHAGAFDEPDVPAAAGYVMPECLCHMGFADSDSDGDRLQQLRAILPCDVRVVAVTHPLFGRLLPARSFKRWNGVLLLVVDLPDGSPGTIRADATDVFGVGGRQCEVSVLDAAGLRELHRLVQRLWASRVAGFVDKAQVGSPHP